MNTKIQYITGIEDYLSEKDLAELVTRFGDVPDGTHYLEVDTSPFLRVELVLDNYPGTNESAPLFAMLEERLRSIDAFLDGCLDYDRIKGRLEFAGNWVEGKLLENGEFEGGSFSLYHLGPPPDRVAEERI